MNWGRERPAWGRPAVSEDGILLERRPSVACSGAGLVTQKLPTRAYNALAADVPSGPQGKTVLKLAFPMQAIEVQRIIESRYRLFGSRKYGDAVAPEGPYTRVTADRDCHGARCEGFGIRLIDELCYFQCFGIDPHHVVVCCPWPAAKMEPSGANRILLH